MFGVPTVVWQRCVLVPYLSPRDLCRLSQTCKQALHLVRDDGLWEEYLRNATGLPTTGLRKFNPRLLFASCYNAADVEPLRNAVRLQHIQRACELPQSNREAAHFFLYWYWSGHERLADHLKVLKLTPLTAKVKEAYRLLQITVETSQPLLLMYGYGGIASCVDVVVVSRSLPGNRAVLWSFSEGYGPMRNHDRRKKGFNLCCRAALAADGLPAELQVHVSTPSKSNYRDIGRLCHNGNEEHFFDVARSRVAGMTHAEGRNFSSRDVDARLQQSTSMLPNIAAGGVVQLRVLLPIRDLFEACFPQYAVKTSSDTDNDAPPP